MNKVDMEKLQKQSKNRFVLSLFILITVVVLSLTGVVLLLIFSKDQYLLNYLLSVLILVVMSWMVIFYFTSMYKQLAYMYNLTKKYVAFNVSEGYFTILEEKEIVKNKITFKAYKVSYLDGGETRTRDLLLFDDFKLNPNDNIKGKLFQNYLIECEVINHEVN